MDYLSYSPSNSNQAYFRDVGQQEHKNLNLKKTSVFLNFCTKIFPLAMNYWSDFLTETMKKIWKNTTWRDITKVFTETIDSSAFIQWDEKYPAI